MTKTMSNIKVNQRGLSVEHDEQRIYELGFGNSDKNFRNYKFFTVDMHFGLAPTLLEEAAFQLLGYERFAIAGMGDKNIMPNPWDDLFNTLKWAIDNKGLNPDYLKRVSKYDFSLPENENGERPQHTSDKEWENYVNQVNRNERRIFSSEELREIAAVLPDAFKLDLLNDLVNISRIAEVRAVVNHILVQNDGDDAVRFVNAVKERRQLLRDQGLPVNSDIDRKIIRELLTDSPLLAMPMTRDAERKRVPESSKLLDKQKSDNKVAKKVKMNDRQEETPRRSFHR
jgi:hypothetical protein